MFSNAQIKPHNGRPTIFVNGEPTALPSYSPVGLLRADLSKAQSARFAAHRLGAYFVTVPSIEFTDWAYFFDTPFWVGDRISSSPLAQSQGTLDEQVEHILRGDPDAHIIVRFGTHEPKSWRDLHLDQCFVTEEGERLAVPSLASELFNRKAAEFSRAIIEHCESRGWANRVIGYANFTRMEGTHEPVVAGWVFDHSPLMVARWRQFLRDKYHTDAAISHAYGGDALSLKTIAVPRDQLRQSAPAVADSLYFQNACDNQATRDYLLLQRELYQAHFVASSGAMRDAVENAGRQRILVYDTFKQTLLGWANAPFFDAGKNWPLAFPDDRAFSGGVGMSQLWNLRGFDGLITPHDYQARGVGGIYEPEGSADSAVTRGKIFFCEMDVRTYCGTDVNFPARDDREFAAVTWRNLATSWTRGFHSYWMDVYQDWFATPAIHQIIARQVEVCRESVNWKHEDVPAIAIILDDEAVLETNGNGQIFNEQVLWNLKLGLVRCGVPYRVYGFDDLGLENFPRHKLFYFPNLYRADAARLALLKRTILRDGNVVVWGPGSGISDGERIGVESAATLTDFEFSMLEINHPRRALVSDFAHPITRNLPADTILGSALAFGPVIFPTDGRELARAWTNGGRDLSGLSVKSVDNAGEQWHSVFSTVNQLPADLWRNLARFSGTHVYCESNDIVLANSNLVALHSIQSGHKRLELPDKCEVFDVVSGERIGQEMRAIEFELQAPQTRVFRLRK